MIARRPLAGPPLELAGRQDRCKRSSLLCWSVGASSLLLSGRQQPFCGELAEEHRGELVGQQRSTICMSQQVFWPPIVVCTTSRRLAALLLCSFAALLLSRKSAVRTLHSAFCRAPLQANGHHFFATSISPLGQFAPHPNQLESQAEEAPRLRATNLVWRDGACSLSKSLLLPSSWPNCVSGERRLLGSLWPSSAFCSAFSAAEKTPKAPPKLKAGRWTLDAEC